MSRRHLLAALARWWLSCTLALHAFGCAAFGRAPAVAASQVLDVAKELLGIVDAVAPRILGPKGQTDVGLATRLASLVERARAALLAIVHVSESSADMLPPEEARALFGAFLDAYSDLWLELRARGLLDVEGRLLSDGGAFPTVEDCRACVARGTEPRA